MPDHAHDPIMPDSDDLTSPLSHSDDLAETLTESPNYSLPITVTLGIAAVFTIALGVLPSLWTNLVETGVMGTLALR